MTSAWQAGHLVRTGCSRNCWAVIITPGWAITVTLECPAVIGWYPGWYPATLNKVNKYKAMFFAWIKYYRNKTAKRKKTKSQTKSQDSIYQPIYDFIKYTHLLHWYWKKNKSCIQLFDLLNINLYVWLKWEYIRTDRQNQTLHSNVYIFWYLILRA